MKTISKRHEELMGREVRVKIVWRSVDGEDQTAFTPGKINDTIDTDDGVTYVGISPVFAHNCCREVSGVWHKLENTYFEDGDSPQGSAGSWPEPNAPTICLYGNDEVGHGYLAGEATNFFGEGAPILGWTVDDAIRAACKDLEKAGFSGYSWVYLPGGKFRARVEVLNPLSIDDLAFKVAPVLTISADEIIEAAEEQAGQ